MKSGANPKIAVSMYYRKARFYLDVNHFFTIEMMPLKYARIKVLHFIIFKLELLFYFINYY